MAKRSTSATETMEGFAEDLGRLLGTARTKAEGWLGQRQNIAKQLTGIRDTASELLQQITAGGAKMAAAVRRGRRRGAQVAKRATRQTDGQKRKMSAKARRAISAAQKRRWAKLRAQTKKQ